MSLLYWSDFWGVYNGPHKLDSKINKMRYNFKTK